MPSHAPTYFPGSPPGADPLFDMEAAYARAVAEHVPSYPLAYGAWIETQPDRQALADAIKAEQARHAEDCPKRAAFVSACSCGRSP